MPDLNGAIERIKRLECPTGDVEYRVAGILEEYGFNGIQEVDIYRDEDLDRDGAEAFTTTLPGNNEHSLVVLAKSGPEDYVAEVVDAYIH